jgi:protein SCO1/2
MKIPTLVIAVLVATAGLGAVVYRGADRSAPASAASTNAPPGTASDRDEPAGHLTVPDVALVNQRGEPIRLSELIRDKVVAISFIYTSCPTICPLIGASFARLQESLGARAGRDVELISITLDPVGDTPARLGEWGKRFGAGSGWTLAGGDPGEIDRLLKVLGVYTAAKEAHAPIFLIGDASRGEWVRMHGVASPERLLGGVERLLAQHPAPGPRRRARTPERGGISEIRPSSIKTGCPCASTPI